MHVLIDFHEFLKDFGRILGPPNEGFWLHPRKRAFGSKTAKTCKKRGFLHCLGEHMLKILNKSSKAQGDNIEEKVQKIKVRNHLPKLETLNFRSHFGLPKPSFRDLGGIGYQP